MKERVDRVVRDRALSLLIGVAAACGAVRADGVPLVWHVERADGTVVASRGADDLVHPASLVKLVTTLWALERLGPDHRFVTAFGCRGEIDADGVLHGDLIVTGGADPDFQVENAALVARALGRAGLRSVAGRLLVGTDFWIGWDRGVSGRDPAATARRMAARLRDAWDPARRSPAVRDELAAWAERNGFAATEIPSLPVAGGVGLATGAPGRPLVEHRGNPLRELLRRFNAFSNNDLARLGATLGPPEDLDAFLRSRLGDTDAAWRIDSLSGLGDDRLTPRLVVRVLDLLRRSCARHDLAPRDVIPVAGCDPGTLDRFHRLDTDTTRGAVAAKTGTLKTTAGGVAALAGYARTKRGLQSFCVIAPRAGRRLAAARGAEEAWLVDVIAAAGGAEPSACGPPLPFSDTEAEVTRAER